MIVLHKIYQSIDFPLSYYIVRYTEPSLRTNTIKQNNGGKAGDVGGSTSLEAVGEAVGAAVEGVVTTAETGLFCLYMF